MKTAIRSISARMTPPSRWWLTLRAGT